MEMTSVFTAVITETIHSDELQRAPRKALRVIIPVITLAYCRGLLVIAENKHIIPVEREKKKEGG